VAVTARGSTVLVANQRTVWRTNDFERWRSVTLPSAYLATLTVHDGAVLAAGVSTEGSRHSAIWRSRDLRHWDTTYTGAPAKHSNITTLVSGGSTVLALGYAGDQEVQTPGLLLESHDGRRWARADPSLPVPGAPTAATVDRESFLVVVDETRLLP
jgi:hypothetical protein